MNKNKAWNSWIRRVEQTTVIRTIRSALINLIPVLTIGAFALILHTFPVPAYQRALEVTEQATLTFNETTVSALRTLRGMGFLLAIDDFSMGQTSIHYLKDNLFDAIKLDGSLVRGLFSHENSREIVSSIIGLADTLSLTVLAEFVETERQRDMLHELGCECYQGYLYSPAMFLTEEKPGGPAAA